MLCDEIWSVYVSLGVNISEFPPRILRGLHCSIHCHRTGVSGPASWQRSVFRLTGSNSQRVVFLRKSCVPSSARSLVLSFPSRATLQYDSVSRILGWQSCFRWIVRPGNDIYFVWLNNWLDLDDRLTSIDRMATKIVYTHSF